MTSRVQAEYEDKKNDLVVKDFLGVNTQAGRTAIKETEFAWLENMMPIGFANLRCVPHQGAAVATMPASSVSSWEYVNLNNVDYLIIIAATGAAYALNLSSYAFTTIAAAATFSLPVGIAQWENERVLFVDATNYRSWDGTLLLANGSVVAVTVTAAGAAYTAVPTLTFSGGSGLGAAAVASMKLVGAQTITAAGTGYTAGDVLTLAGGTSTQTAKLRVTTVGGAGDVTAVSIYQVGSYTVLPAAPNTVTGGTGTGCTITHAWGVDTVRVTNGGTTAYVSAPTIAFSSGAATATAAIIGGPEGGQFIETFAGRVWIFKDRTYSYSAPGSFSDFTVANAGGAVVITDATLRSVVTGTQVANNFLFYWGNSSIAAISDVRVVPGTPYVTVFSDVNVSAIIGSTFGASIFPYYRSIAFATRYGLYALTGATPQKISDALDGMFDDIDFTQSVTGAVAIIYKTLCMAFLFRYNDPAADARALLAVFFNKKWFFANQGADLTLIAGALPSGIPSLFGTDGTSIYKLFSDIESDIDTKIVTPLWPLKAPTVTKQTLKGGVEVNTTDVLTELDIAVDTDVGSYPLQLIADNLGEWENASGVRGSWSNSLGVSGDWLTTGFQIFQGDIEAYGRYVGYTVTSSSPQHSVQGLLMQYERKAQWATRA